MVGWAVAAGEDAAAVARGGGSALACGGETDRAAEVEGLAGAVGDQPADGGVAGQVFEGPAAERGAVFVAGAGHVTEADVGDQNDVGA